MACPSLDDFLMVGLWLPATTFATAGNELTSGQHKEWGLALMINKPSIVFAGTSVPFERRLRNSQALFTVLRENPLNRVSNKIRPGA
jgi:hypothetical protein